MKRHLVRITAGFVGVAAIVSVAIAPAAQARPVAPLSASASGLHPLVTSDYLAGYGVTEPGIYHASASLVVPTMDCSTAADPSGTAVGIGNEQAAGSPTLLAMVFLACLSGAPYLTIEAEAGNPATTNFGAANAGDVLVFSITQGKSKVTATVTDKTTPQTITASGTPYPDNSLVFGDFPLFSGTTQVTVANFGSVTFRAPYLENALLMDWAPTKLNRTSGTTTEITTRNFAATGGFKLVYLAP